MASYLSQFEANARAAVASGVILPRVVEGLSVEASETWDSIVG